MTRVGPSRPSVANAARIARYELRRSRRRMSGRTSKQIQFAVLALVVPLYSLGAAAGAFFAGRVVAAGDAPAGAPAWAGAGLLAIALFVAFFVVQQHLKTGGIDPMHGLLTTVSYADVAAGLVLATLGRVMAWLVVPIALVAVAFGVGAGSPLSVATTTLFLASAVGLGVLLGLVLGLLIPLVTHRSAFLTRHKSAIGFVLSLLLPAAWILGTVMDDLYRPIAEVLLASPATWAGHALLVPVAGTSVDPALAAGGFLATPVILAVGLAATVGLAGRVWYGDPVQPDHEYHRRSERRFDPFAGVPATAAAVARKSLRRARRSPFTVQFAIFPFFFLVFQLQPIVVAGRVPPVLAVELAVAGATTGGAAFSLNPLGAEERVLPLTLTARVTGWEFVGGLAVAGAVIGLPLAVVLPVLAGLAAGLGPIAIVAAVLTGVVIGATAPGVAAGLGVAVPKFERSTVGTGREVVVPSTWAFVGYVLVLGPVALPAVLTQLPGPRSSIGELLGAGPVVVLLGGLLVTAALAVGAGVIGYAHAANRVGTYRLD